MLDAAAETSVCERCQQIRAYDNTEPTVLSRSVLLCISVIHAHPPTPNLLESAFRLEGHFQIPAYIGHPQALTRLYSGLLSTRCRDCVLDIAGMFHVPLCKVLHVSPMPFPGFQSHTGPPAAWFVLAVRW